MQITAGTVGGIVLCGGRSRRMGTAKEWLTVGEEYLLQRIVRIVSSAVKPVVVAARRGQALPPLPPDIEVVFDEQEDQGPLLGLLAGMERLVDRCSAVFVTGCDYPLLSPQVIRLLIDHLTEMHDAVVPVHDGREYPLTAVYRITTCPRLRDSLDQGERTARAFAAKCLPAYVQSDELQAVDPWLDSFLNVNEPGDLERLIRGARLNE